MNVDTLSGRELDAMVAQHVFGLFIEPRTNSRTGEKDFVHEVHPGQWVLVPLYTASMAASISVVAVGGLASPAQARAVMRSIRTVTHRPLRWLVLYAHHPDMMFGAIEFKRAGAGIVAHPDRRVAAAEGGPDMEIADWDRVVGLGELVGFAFA